MKKPIPTGAEKFFEFEELFFSRTDTQSLIRSGNDVFVRISGYPRDVMLGAPHNLVRHPEMPRSVFKVFWSFLKSNRPIGAYVRNLSAEGESYWVFAAAFPIRDGYLSIRLRPSSPLLARVKELYELVLEEESRNGMDGGEKLLLDLLAREGFPDYEAFMTKALGLELQSRDQHLSARKKDGTQGEPDLTDPVIASIHTQTRQGEDVFQDLFERVREFVESQDFFSQKTEDMIRRFQGIRFLSINMTASAEKLGSSATTLAVVSGEFQKMAGEIEKHLRMFLETAAEIALDMRRTSFNVSSLKLQMDMVAFFVQESLEKMSRHEKSDDAFLELKDNRPAFEELGDKSIREAKENLSRLRQKLKKFESALDEIEAFASGLEIVRQMGHIESARSTELRQAFENQITELKDFTGFLRESSLQLNHSTRTLGESTARIEANIPLGGRILKDIFAQAIGEESRAEASFDRA